jgi:RHS repeat-associated protein
MRRNTFHYSALRGLTSAKTADNNENFRWDRAENLLLPEKTSPIIGNRLQTWECQRNGVTQPCDFQYDAFGRITIKSANSHRKKQTLVWDDEDHLLEIRGENGVTRFDYDPLGRRIGKHFTPANDPNLFSFYAPPPQPTESTLFVWEGMRMVQEIRRGRRRTWIYDPVSAYVPLACVDQYPEREEIHYAHTDPLGTIQELTDAAGLITWSARYSAWGQRQDAAPVAMADKAARQTDCQLRFQGQYEDVETGLHYNTFRYYDPEMGRFVSPDPIGIAGGFNLYQYAPNPTGWVDPWGWHKNSNSTVGDWVLYKVENQNGDIAKVGIGKAEDKMKNGENRRAEASARRVRKDPNFPNAEAEILDTHHGITKGEMKEIEAERVRELRRQGHALPHNRENDRRYRAKTGC